MNQVFFGDCRDTMRDLIARGIKVQCCVTSPPYFGLRDYLHPGQLGLENSPKEYVDNMVEVFRLVRDMLADDGTLWLNMGDSYAGSWGAQGRPQGNSGEMAGRSVAWARTINAHPRFSANTGTIGAEWGLKPKDLLGMPWRLAFALQDDGWWLRQDIIFHKPNPMPESVRDRCTKAHEYLFLLAKSERYYFDFEAFAEPASGTANARVAQFKTPDGWDTSVGNGSHGSFHKDGREKGRKPGNVNPPKGQLAYEAGDDRHRTKAGLLAYARKVAEVGTGIKNNASMDDALRNTVQKRNRRSVWTIASEQYSGAHFATFPAALVEPCIIAGSRPGDIVLDPFFGSGTTGQVAQRLGRQWLGCEIQPAYKPLQDERLSQQSLVLL